MVPCFFLTSSSQEVCFLRRNILFTRLNEQYRIGREILRELFFLLISIGTSHRSHFVISWIPDFIAIIMQRLCLSIDVRRADAATVAHI